MTSLAMYILPGAHFPPNKDRLNQPTDLCFYSLFANYMLII